MKIFQQITCKSFKILEKKKLFQIFKGLQLSSEGTSSQLYAS